MRLLLAVLLIATAAHAEPYKRTSWMTGWIDADHDCQDTRTEALIAQALEVTLSEDTCTVVSGTWYDPYTDQIYHDPHVLDLDHVVPLAAAHRMGGSAWSKEKRREYANDLEDAGHLLMVSASANRAKGDKMPSRWKPPNRAFWCEYALDIIHVVKNPKWHLRLTNEDAQALVDMVDTCLVTPIP